MFALFLCMITATFAQTSKHEKEFVQQILPYAKELQRKYNIPVSATTAMAAYESGFGRSKLSRNANNYFGIKALSRKYDGPKYYIMTKDFNKTVRRVQPFRRYSSMRESVMDYGQFLAVENMRYRKAFRDETLRSGKRFVAAVARAGYCPDYTYVRNVSCIIDRHNLECYDLPVIHLAKNIGADYRGIH